MDTSPNEFEQALAAIGMNHAQLEQQADVARRLLAMACTGTPFLGAESKLPPKTLALHALASAYLALSTNEPGLTAIGAALATDIGRALDAEHTRRLQADIDYVLGLAAADQLPAVTH